LYYWGTHPLNELAHAFPLESLSDMNVLMDESLPHHIIRRLPASKIPDATFPAIWLPKNAVCLTHKLKTCYFMIDQNIDSWIPAQNSDQGTIK
jgi:hypothetical protein